MACRKDKLAENKGISTELFICTDEDLSNTTNDSETIWKTPSKLKEEVKTIIDIMGPSLSPKFAYNTSSEADNEESIFSNSKFSITYKKGCHCKHNPKKLNFSEANLNYPETPSKDDEGYSAATDLNTGTLSATLDDLTDTKDNFPYDESPCYPNPQYICPPPLLPANICMNSECLCPQNAGILQGRNVPMPPCFGPYAYGMGAMRPTTETVHQSCQIDKTKSELCKDSKNCVLNWLKTIVSFTQKPVDKEGKCEFYKMNVKKRGDGGSPPRRVVFELVQSCPKYIQTNHEDDNVLKKPCSLPKDQKNTANKKICDVKNKKISCQNLERKSLPDVQTMETQIEETFYHPDGKTRVDVYYFDHGSFSHYRTTDAPPLVVSEAVADKAEKHTTRFWAEIFGTVHIGMSFVTSFILQFFRFILYSIIRPLTIGLVQLASDYFFKPLLATLFNGLIQPILIFLYNTAATLRDLCDPISEGIGYFIREVSICIGAFRIVEVKRDCAVKSQTREYGTKDCGKSLTDCKSERKTSKTKTLC